MKGRVAAAFVREMPEECEHYVVARVYDGELWFWGSWPEHEAADKVAKEIDGVTLEVIV